MVPVLRMTTETKQTGRLKHDLRFQNGVCMCVCGLTLCHTQNINLFFKGPHSQRGNPSSSLVSNQKTQTPDLQRWRNVWGKICLYQGHISNCGSLKHINVLPLRGVSHVLWSYDAGIQMMGHMTRSFHLCHRKYCVQLASVINSHCIFLRKPYTFTTFRRIDLK